MAPADKYNDATDDRSRAKYSIPEATTSLPLALVGLLLHHGRRNRGRRGRQSHAGIRIYYGDGVASAQRRRLMKLHLLIVVGLVASDRVVRVVGGGRGERKARGSLRLRLYVGLERR